MADLQTELNRFREARFGADVKDSFISCVQKIHEENQQVESLHQSMTETAEEVESNKADILKEVDDAKVLAVAAENRANSALSEAMNASNSAADASDNAETALNAANQVKQGYDTMRLVVSGKIDGAYVENGYLYLTSDGEVVAGPLGPFSGTGGGSGGSGNNAVLSVTNTSGWLSKTVAFGAECPVKVLWSSEEDEIPTGNGVLKIFVNGILKAMLDIRQGEISIDVNRYLSAGSNTVKFIVSDVYENSRTINFSINAIEVSISSSFDASAPFNGLIQFTYTPVGNIRKNIHILLDDQEIMTMATTGSGRQMSYMIPSQSHGAHTLEAYFDAEVDGQSVESNHLYYEIICIESLNKTPIIVSSFHDASVSRFTSLAVPFTVYDPASMTAEIILSVNGNEVSRQTVDRTEQIWSYRADTEGTVKLGITCRSTMKELSFEVTPSEISVEAETDSLALFLSSYGRSNNEAAPEEWKYGEIDAELTGFNFTSDGWQMDEDMITVLRVAGDARVDIPVKPFASDFRTTGKTIEIEFATRDVMDYDAVIMSCLSGGRGFSLTPQMAVLRSEQSEIFTQYKENEHVRITFVVEKRSENRLIYCYINGIMSGVVQYPSDDDFSQKDAVNISIGSNDCVTDIYCIRIYDNDLTRHQILDNWIADTRVVTDMLDRYSRNALFDAYDNIVIAQLPKDLPYLVLEAEELPQYKGDKKTVSGYYVDPVNAKNNFSFTGAQADVQGTSSQYYARKNYKIKFKGGFTNASGITAEAYAMNESAVPTSTFTFKADVASSEGANNVELVRLYNDACPFRTSYQKADPDVRQGIDGFPIIIFWNDGDRTTFLGKYNFNNDKSTEEVFGFTAGDESWEVSNNTSDRVLWKSDDYEGTDWLNDFEGRYPDGNTDASNLAALAGWLVSTDRTKASGQTITPMAYDGKTYSTDTAEYRLAKFKAEFSDHFEKEAVLFYYLFTELFLMVDSRAKNMFPSFMGGSKWFSLPYDFDTAIGINNEGALVFSYNLEDIDHTDGGADVYNGQQSVLWVNVRDAFFDDIKAMYQSLRSKGTLSYTDTEERFEKHQNKWPEAVFNEDAYFKYLAPLVEENSAAYLSMLQGSKAEQRKWWLYNRFRYMDSKYNAGDSLSDVITLRGYAKDNITLIPYADVYTSIKYGSYLVQTRAERNKSYTLVCPLDNVNDTEIYIYSASQLKSIGDISGLMVGYAEFSMGTKLQELKVGDGSSSYSNGNLTELYLGNNRLLKKLDVRNCPNLKQTVDISGCGNIEEVYFDGTAITGLQLPNGGILKKLHLPATITNLTIRNQKSLTEFVLPGYSNISTLRLENVGAGIDTLEAINSVPVNTRVRLIGFEFTAADMDELLAFYDHLDTMRGLDENGNNMDKAQVQGKIHIDTIQGSVYAELLERYPSIEIVYEHISSIVYFYDYSGSTLLATATSSDGASVTYPKSSPARSSTAQYIYTFSGWASQPNGSAVNDALTNIRGDKMLYAAYTSSVQKYTVRFYNGTTLLETQTVAYGSRAVYSGATPVYSGEDAEDWGDFLEWAPSNMTITGSTDFEAVFAFTGSLVTSFLEGTIKEVNLDVTNVGAHAFYSCDRLVSVNFPKATSVGAHAFYGCTNLKSVKMPLVTTFNGSYVFSGCTKLNSIEIPKLENLTTYVFDKVPIYQWVFPSVKTVSSYAFYYSSFTIMDLHSVKSIDKNAFPYCNSMKALILRGDEIPVCTKPDSLMSSSATKIYVPQTLLEAYKTDAAWSTVASRLIALEGSEYE